MIISHYKIFIMKKFILGAAFIAVASVATSASALTNYGGTLIKYGSRGEAVKTVQMCLSEMGYSNAGSFDGIYGTKTLAQVKSYQADKNLAQDGIVGPLTWAALDCEADTDTDTSVDVEEFVLGGEGETTNFEIKGEDDAFASTEEEHVATIEFEVEDGDVNLEKIDLYFGSNDDATDNANDVWENIEKVTLTVDGKEIASADVSDDDEWNEEDTDASNTDVYSLSLKGDAVFKDGDKVEIEVLVDTTDEVESTDTAEDYNLWAELRFSNAEGVLTYEGGDADDDSDAIAFKVKPLGLFDIDFDENSDSPEDDKSLDLSDDLEETLVIVDAEIGEDQGGTLETAVVKLTAQLAAGSTATDADELIDEVQFMVDGKEVDADSVDTSVTTAATILTYTFDLDDIEVSAEDEIEFEVVGAFNSIEDDSEFVNATVKVTSIEIKGEDQEGNNFSGVTYTETTSYAPIFKASAGDVDVEFNGDLELLYTGDHAGTAKFEVKITNNTGSDMTGMDVLANWTLDVDGLIVSGTNPTAVTDKDEVALTADGMTINDGETETYTVTVTFTGDSNVDAEVTIEELAAENISVTATVSE
jgi:hypothetical protein